jgi:uncharacterized NAD(P)/FAD-binding protein YdhS
MALATSASLLHSVKASTHAEPRSVVIVGGGFAGAALAYHLLKRPSPLRVTIVDRGTQLGRGVAYAAKNAALRLNVPAARMSLDPAQPDDFVRFAGSEANPDAFLPRHQFGTYVEARLRHVARLDPERFHVHRGEAIGVAPGVIQLADGTCLAADRVVLATGVAARSNHGRWPTDARVMDAWDEACCMRAATGGRVLLVGSGLSAVDVLSLLKAWSHQGEVVVLSRHGLLPRPHAAQSGALELPPAFGLPPANLRDLIRWVRALTLEAERRGAPWQHVIDALRPHLQSLWQRLSVRDRGRFAVLVRPYWEVLRHRAPPDVLADIEEQRTRGQVQVLSGRVLACYARERSVDVTLRVRGGSCRVEHFSHVVRCLGPALSVDAATSPLMELLIRNGVAQRDPAGLGIVTLESGRLCEASGLPSRQLFALGHPCRASRWETTSAPDIVRDAVALAELLITEAVAVNQRSMA